MIRLRLTKYLQENFRLLKLVHCSDKTKIFLAEEISSGQKFLLKVISHDKAFFMKVQDVVRCAVDETRFTLTVDKLREATQISLKHDPVKSVELLADKFQLTENERGDILRQLFMGADNSRYGLINAVTAASKIAKSYERATDLERIGGEILSLPVPKNILPPPSYDANLAIPEYETISA